MHNSRTASRAPSLNPDGERSGALGARRRSDTSILRSLVVAAVVAIVAVLVGPAAPASAHATLLFTSPAVDGAVPSSPEAIQLIFDQGVVPSGASLRLTDDTGRGWRLGEVEAGSSDQTLSARVLDTLPAGAYIVSWQATAPDAEVMVGLFRFAVGSISGLSLAGGGDDVVTRGLTATAALRWLLFAGLAMSLGGLVGGTLASRVGRAESGGMPQPWLRTGALVGASASAGLALILIGGGSMLDGLRTMSLEALLASTPGRLALTQVVAFGGAAGLIWLKQHAMAGVVLLVVPVAEGLRAHPQAVNFALGATATAVHVAAAAVWIGALIHVVRVGLSWRRQGASAAPLVGSYARMALWLVLAVVVSGSIAGLLLIPIDELGSTLVGATYGRWLLVKLLLVAVVAVLALWARIRLRRRPTDPQPTRAASWEVTALVCVLGVSGLLTALGPPVQADQALPFAPPAVGPVVAVGSRAGFIGVGVTASNGQVLVRLTSPDTALGLDEEGEKEFTLVGNVSRRGEDRATNLAFRACGAGCFVAPTTWMSGLNTVTLEAVDETDGGSLAGGTTAVNVAWPPRPAPEQLKRVVAAMRQVGQFTLYEQVTSDTTDGLGIQRRLRLTGRAFLESDPFGSGVAPVATLMTRSEDESTLAVAYPAEGIYIVLTVDKRGRIIREQLAAPKHLVSRTFVYPDP